MKWYQRLGIVAMFACIIQCFFIFTTKPIDIGFVIVTIIFGLIGITLLMID